MVQIRCKNNNTTRSFAEGSSLLDVLQAFEGELHFAAPVVSARVNNTSHGLSFRVYQSRDVEFVPLSDDSGMRVYTRSLCFVLYKACLELFPESSLYVEHSISGGYYCKFYTRGQELPSPADIELIRQRMQAIIDQDLPFCHHEGPTDEVVALFTQRGLHDKALLLQTGDSIYSDYYTLGDTIDYYYGPLLPSTSMLKVWGLEEYHDGLLLRVPRMDDVTQLEPRTVQEGTFEVFAEYLKWGKIMGTSNVGDLNVAIDQGKASELIQVGEALQEKKIVRIAEQISQRFYDPERPCRLVLITGPSSSGKTTFCKRLSIQLMACGLRPMSFSTDDYFVNRVDTPKFPDGRYDFENIAAVDTATMEQHLNALLRGETVEVPEYNFKTGMREYNGKLLELGPNAVLLIEGIHALNPLLTSQIDDKLKFRIFIAPLTSMSLDNHNWIPTRDTRLLRRIIRDSNKGAFSARQTIQLWPDVGAGEHLWIYPYQETADVMFNSALDIEFAVMRQHAEPMLASVPRNCPEYYEAHRLLRFLHYFSPVSDKEIPPTSIMREFVGGSSFKY